MLPDYIFATSLYLSKNPIKQQVVFQVKPQVTKVINKGNNCGSKDFIFIGAVSKPVFQCRFGKQTQKAKNKLIFGYHLFSLPRKFIVGLQHSVDITANFPDSQPIGISVNTKLR
ncbi:hypothetical protein J7438_19530 [Thalassotalea sp. G20_0]|uniref:hypothetical protein n=1 Tax=Thalassotalea sp. G20_0 TaxID=2821093 RepID=UPI001ADC3040|nr:hypothetical protein [Thalassotalea sp. G20_0]MBO9496250.1 hypothetical protein [Thalassotalea sp. G20_0]